MAEDEIYQEARKTTKLIVDFYLAKMSRDSGVRMLVDLLGESTATKILLQEIRTSIDELDSQIELDFTRARILRALYKLTMINPPQSLFSLNEISTDASADSEIFTPDREISFEKTQEILDDLCKRGLVEKKENVPQMTLINFTMRTGYCFTSLGLSLMKSSVT